MRRFGPVGWAGPVEAKPSKGFSFPTYSHSQLRVCSGGLSLLLAAAAALRAISWRWFRFYWRAEYARVRWKVWVGAGPVVAKPSKGFSPTPLLPTFRELPFRLPRVP